MTESSPRSRVAEVARVFFRFGLTAFGGPAAHIGLLEDETVKRRKWLSREEFLDLLGVTHLIPGPNSTELCIHLGYRRAGLPGLVVAGLGFVVPAALITGILAWVYRETGDVQLVGDALRGVKPVILAIIAGAIVRLARTAFRDGFLIALSVAAAACAFAGVNELVILLGGGVVGALRVLERRLRSGTQPLGCWIPGLFLLGGPSAAAASGAAGASGAASLTSLGLFFLKVGSVLYGSGYILLAFIRQELVVERAWLTESELLDAVAVGQFTPGPLLSTASFVGYLVLGWPGAIVATIGVFLPSFVFVLITHRWISRMRSSKILSGFLDAINATAVGLMVAVVLALARDALAEWPAWIIGGLAVPAVVLTRVNPTWWILLGGGLGLLLW